jgi:hypothetical protein
MIGNNVDIILSSPDQHVFGELRKQTPEGIWVWYGAGDYAALHFYPQHRIVQIIDRGPNPRW